jgi:hypothetical protein
MSIHAFTAGHRIATWRAGLHALLQRAPDDDRLLAPQVIRLDA